MKVFGKSLHKSLKNEEKRPEASQMDLYGYKKDKKEKSWLHFTLMVHFRY